MNNVLNQQNTTRQKRNRNNVPQINEKRARGNSTQLNKLLFCKETLLSNLQINDNFIKLINSYVKILLIIERPHIILYGFFEITKSKGMARCALYFLLLYLLDNQIIQLTDIIDVSSPTPDNGNMARLIKIYKEIGFNHLQPKLGRPIVLSNTIENIITKLSEQCGEQLNCITRGGNIRKTKLRKKYKLH